jgi:predicted lipid-binding transport protein (Tim44 family)
LSIAGDEMVTIQRLMVLHAAVLVASMSSSYAGPCSPEIERMQARIDAQLEAKAAAGPNAKESVGALEHRQPTPDSIAAAEERLGEVSGKTAETVTQAMARARAADNAGDKSTCEQALADVQRAIGQ